MLNDEGIAFGGANPIYLASELDLRKGAQIEFEVLEADASQLKKLVGKKGTFGIDAATSGMFVGELTSLESRTSTVQALLFLRDKPAMRGVITVYEQINVNDPKKQA